MRTVIVSALLATALAAPSGFHKHHHHEARAVVTTYKTVTVGANGQVKAETETSSASTATVASSSSSSTSSASKSSTSTSSTSASTASSASSSTSSGSSGSGGIFGDLSAFADPTEEFEDGVHDCDSLPTGQGVIAVDWISGLNGGYTTIMNENGDTASTCQDGYYCSYACQAGMSKTQWPSAQPSSGISVGGLYCKSGKLYKSNSDSNYLCEWGKSGFNFVSEIEKSVAICRTDYPGSENMNIPTVLEAGSTAPVSVVDSDTYFTWEGGKTSTQYYVNNAGVSYEDGCIWGTSSGSVGNWAPVVLGAGYTDGKTYLSLIPNPNNEDAPNYNIKIKGVNGATTVGSCSYVDGTYSGSSSDGCTFTVTDGEAEFLFY